jgi:hypothetical protein
MIPVQFLDLKLLCEFAAGSQELQIRRTGFVHNVTKLRQY